MLRKLNISFVSLVFLLNHLSVRAQQQGLYSQYMMNYYLVNPAAIGVEDHFDLRSGYRMQWTGFAGTPRNYYVSGHSPLNKAHANPNNGHISEHPYHALGGLISGQTLGLLAHHSGCVTYAYHIPLNSDWLMSVGANVGFSQMSVNQEDADWGDGSSYDPSVDSTKASDIDMALGIWLHSKDVFMGFSSTQLLNNGLEFSMLTNDGILNRHFYFTGGMKLDVNQDINIVPSLMIRGTHTAFQFDLNAKVNYKGLYWGGFSYRRQDAFLAMIGAAIPLSNGPSAGHLEIGYSYDLITSRLTQYSSGSHEIMIALVVPPKGKVVCPKFW